MHGVSGTPPAELLYASPVTYDQGDDLAKVYRTNRDCWDVEAFHWGSLTSKSSLTAFWILLAPFAMANVAGWMTESPNIWSRIWIRVAGLTLTGIFFAQIANIALDLPLAAGTNQNAVFWVYTAACLLLVVGLGLLSTQSSFKKLSLVERLSYLFVPTIGAMNPVMREREWDDPAVDLGVVGVHLWGVHSIAHRLRRIHFGFGAAVLALVAARAVGDTSSAVSAIAVAGAAMVVLAFTTDPTASNRIVLAITAVLPLAGVTVLVWALSMFLGGEVVASNVADDLTYEISLILGIAAGLGLVGELIKSRLRSGWVPLGLLAVAALVGATLGLTGTMLAESYLFTPLEETFDQGATFVTLGMLGMVIVMAATFAVASLRRRKPSDGTPMRRGILRARAVLASAGFYAVAIGIVAVALSCRTGAGCSQHNIEVPSWILEDPDSLVVWLGISLDPTSLLGWAKLTMVAVPSVLIVRSIVGGLLNGQDSRRQVGILWDLGSFWPRWFHPLAPPAYGPYAVTRLQTVIDQVEPDVLSAHSQGSLLSAVALSLSGGDRTPGLFVTYGSQIGDLYPSLFPAVGFDRMVAEVDRQVSGRWINLWRDTDGVGGQPIEALGQRNWIVDTGTGHSRYELTPEFCAARKTLSTGLTGRPPDTEIADCWTSG